MVDQLLALAVVVGAPDTMVATAATGCMAGVAAGRQDIALQTKLEVAGAKVWWCYKLLLVAH